MNQINANFPNRSLCQGDNLDFLRSMNSESVDLIATDPPFNSGRDYFANPNSIAKGAYFPDKWAWSVEMRDQHLNELKKINPKAHYYVECVWQTLGDGALTSFLLFMSLRLVEMKRVLKPTGSIYLHCDYHASHYLKQLMDIVFGMDNFRNQIVWRIGWVSGYKSQKRGWIRNHDILLYYVMSDEAKDRFNKEYIPYPKGYVRRDGKPPSGKGFPIEDTWNCHSGDVLDSIMIKSFSTEKTGYPTQKPVILYERIVKASSNEGEVVLDPFCGCATTLVAAENLGREWIGIDIHPETRTITANRIAETCNLSSPDGSVKAQLDHLDIERDLDIHIFTKEDFPSRTN